MIGGGMLLRWGVSSGALLIAAGIILFLVALNSIRDQYSPVIPDHTPETTGASVGQAAFGIAFPYIVSPYGIAVVVLVSTTRPAGLPGIAVIAKKSVPGRFDVRASAPRRSHSDA